MFKFLTPKGEQVKEKIIQSFKSDKEIIEEIHETFYTEVDRLLVSAKVSNSLVSNKQGLIDKCARLKTLGFQNTKEVKEAQSEIDRLNNLEIENRQKSSLIEAIDYFSIKYPNHKFITEDSVKKICDKYNLVYGSVDRYIGTVPDKNLKQIEDFKISEEDEAYFTAIDGTSNIKVQFFNVKEYELAYKKLKGGYYSSNYNYARITGGKLMMEIAAPLKDFNMTNQEVKDFKISNIYVPDPVVLQPVVFKNQRYYLIVTAWGLEASDELVVNQKMN